MRHLRLFVCVLPLVAVSAGCDEKLSDVTGPTPNLQPTLASITSEVFTSTDSSGRRACSACHTDNGRTPAAGLNLKDATTAFAQLVGRPSARKAGATFVIAGDPENSYLVQKLEGRSDIVGVRMPLGGPYVTDGQMLVIKRWIKEGAKN